MISINEHGLTGIEPLRRAWDGVTFFGCKKTLARDEGDEMGADTGAPALGGQTSEDDSKSSIVDRNDPTKEIVNDFIIPVNKKEDKERHKGRQFQIRYDMKYDGYFIKDL